MKATHHHSVAAFAAVAGPLLDADPVRHTIGHTVLDHLRHGADAALLLTVARRGAVAGAALRVAGRPVEVSAVPPGLAVAAEAASADVDPDPPGASGTADEVEAWASARSARTGDAVLVAMRQRLFRLVTLCPPRGVPGAVRVAGPGDLDLLAAWQADFAAEALRSIAPPGEEPRPGIAASMGRGAAHLLWEVGGRPVAYAVAKPVLAGGSRIGPVYTPPERRGRGFGSAVTAAAAAWAHAAGAREVVLFTDLTNPVSNAIYPRLGFRPVTDACEVRFVPA